MDDLILTPDMDEYELTLKQKTENNIYRILQTQGNYIIIAILAIISILFSFVKFDNGTVALKIPDYDNALGWAVFIAMTLFPVLIGFLIKDRLRSQGIYSAINNPKGTIIKLQNEYDSLLSIKAVEKIKPPRSVDEYKRQKRISELIKNIIIAILLTILTGGVALSGNWEGLAKQTINFLLWGAFGIIDMFDANEFILTEYKRWLIIHIKELKDDEGNS